IAVPFASGFRYLVASALWKNVMFNSGAEAARRLRERGFVGEAMGPGDRIAADGTVRRRTPVLRRDEELAAIADHARRVQPWVNELAAREPPARGDVVDRFRDYVLGLWRSTRARLPGVRRHVIAYVVRGPAEQRFYFDFSRPDDAIFQWGEPPQYDMRYTYPARALQQRVDGRIDWDELHFVHDVSVHQVTYARDFYAMLRSETVDLDRRGRRVESPDL